MKSERNMIESISFPGKRRRNEIIDATNEQFARRAFTIE